MRVTELYQNGKPVISMEFFPPRDETAEQVFSKTVDDLAELNPDYLSVTFGAGGSTRTVRFKPLKG